MYPWTVQTSGRIRNFSSWMKTADRPRRRAARRMAFSAVGQLWGNPLYDWDYHKKTCFAWWLKRLKKLL